MYRVVVHRLLYVVLAVALVLTSLPVLLVSSPQQGVSAAALPLGFNSPILGTVAAQYLSTDIRSTSYQMGVYQTLGAKWARIWAIFDSNYLKAGDIDALYNAGVRNFVVIAGTNTVCWDPNNNKWTGVEYELSTTNVQYRLSMDRGDGNLVDKLKVYVNRTTDPATLWVQLGNEPNVPSPSIFPEYDPNCNGVAELSDLQAYRQQAVTVRNDVSTWLTQVKGLNSARLKFVIGTPAFYAGANRPYDQTFLDTVILDSAVQAAFDAFDVHVYDDNVINVNADPIFASVETDGVKAMRRIVSATSKPVIVGEQNISRCTGFLEEGTGVGPGLARPGYIKGAHNERTIRAYRNAFGGRVLGVLLFATGAWNGADGANCQTSSTPLDSYGNAQYPYVIDAYHVEALKGNTDTIRLANGWGNFTYRSDGAQSYGGVGYIYGNIRGWWSNHPSYQNPRELFLVTDNGVLGDDTPQYNLELGILRARAIGYISTSALSGYEYVYTIGRFPIYVKCDAHGTRPDGGQFCKVGSQANPFDPRAVIRDSAGCPYVDAVTGHQICGTLYSSFWSKIGRERGYAGVEFWETIMLIGRPISGHFYECTSDGCFWRQYFERGVMQINSSTDIQLLPLGQAVEMTSDTEATIGFRAKDIKGLNPYINMVQCGTRFYC